MGKSDPETALDNIHVRKQFLMAIEFDHDLKDYLSEDLDEVTESIKAVKLESNGTLLWEVKTSRVLTKTEERSLENYLTGQCSDGWGEGFEQHPVLIKQDQEYFYSPWIPGSKAKIVKNKIN